MRVAVIINPISGAAGRGDVGRHRAALARRVLTNRRIDHEVLVTESSGHAPALARAAVDRGASIVCAWGGDGTINEIASVLAFTPVALGIVPSGSGNGLARELTIPRRAEAALETMLRQRQRLIDAGEIGGRLFINVAGIGFDALVASRFSVRSPRRRGLVPYFTIAGRELCRYRCSSYTFTTEDESWSQPALLVALANSRQYGNGAMIAPAARVDDGKLDLIVVESRSLFMTFCRVPRLFAGTLARAPGVRAATVRRLSIGADHPIPFHVDGEPLIGDTTLRATIHPRALRVMV